VRGNLNYRKRKHAKEPRKAKGGVDGDVQRRWKKRCGQKGKKVKKKTKIKRDRY